MHKKKQSIDLTCYNTSCRKCYDDLCHSIAPETCPIKMVEKGKKNPKADLKRLDNGGRW
jgi:hypothetical protein